MPTLMSRRALVPVSARLNAKRSEIEWPPYSLEPKSRRRVVASAVRDDTLTAAPGGPFATAGLAAPGWTARNAWSKKKRFTRVSARWLAIVASTTTLTRCWAGSTV